jgi:hypothetical protein
MRLPQENLPINGSAALLRHERVGIAQRGFLRDMVAGRS